MRRHWLVDESGNCSFCGESATDGGGLAGATDVPPRVCGECLELCRQLIEERHRRDRVPDPLLPPDRAGDTERQLVITPELEEAIRLLELSRLELADEVRKEL